MAFKLSAGSLTKAIRHVCKYGDTDVFPHLPELIFLHEQEADVVAELANLDLDVYTPDTAIEALAPKSRFGFRLVHQLPVIDTVLLLAAVIEIGASIEAKRLDITFSYRFGPDNAGAVFKPNHTYREWLSSQQKLIQGNLKIKAVVATDVSDFYSRVNFHRLENLLNQVAQGHGAVRFIKKHIRIIRATQSFGLPVGGSAARLLAELALADVDTALSHTPYLATRFVDDFRIFLKAGEEPYEALAFLAEQLGINEGLALNVAKTRVFTRAEYVEHLKELLTELTDQAEGQAFAELTSHLYFDDEPDPEELEKLKNVNLLGLLQEEVGKEAYDIGRIKLIFRALRITKPQEAIPYIGENFSELVVFAKDVVLLMQALEGEYLVPFNNLGDKVVDTILKPPALSIQLVKSWLLELFVRGTVPLSPVGLKKLEVLTSPLDRRQLLLIRGRMNLQNYFRMQKGAFGQFSSIEKYCLIWGAACLPEDEHQKWLDFIKALFSVPCGTIFLKWARKNRGKLFQKLGAPIEDNQEDPL